MKKTTSFLSSFKKKAVIKLKRKTSYSNGDKVDSKKTSNENILLEGMLWVENDSKSWDCIFNFHINVI